MDWKKRQRQLAEIRHRPKGGVMLPPLPKVHVLKVINPPVCAPMTVKKNLFKKAMGVPAHMIEVLGRWGCNTMVPKKPATQCPFNYINRLQGKGFAKLGSGAYSTVMGKPGSNRVIKVSRSLDNWIEYIEWAAKHGYAGGLAPRVYSWKKHGEGDNAWSVAVVERMKETLHDEKKDFQLMNYLPHVAMRGNLLAQVYMEDMCPGSVAFFEGLRKHNYDSDIGRNNMMVREDGSFCVTDPTCGRLTRLASVKRLRSGELSPTSFMNWNYESSYRYRSECSS